MRQAHVILITLLTHESVTMSQHAQTPGAWNLLLIHYNNVKMSSEEVPRQSSEEMLVSVLSVPGMTQRFTFRIARFLSRLKQPGPFLFLYQWVVSSSMSREHPLKSTLTCWVTLKHGLM